MIYLFNYIRFVKLKGQFKKVALVVRWSRTEQIRRRPYPIFFFGIVFWDSETWKIPNPKQNSSTQMSTISATSFRSLFSIASPRPSTLSTFLLPSPLLLPKFRSCPNPLASSYSSPSRTTVACSNSSEEAEVSQTLDEWLQKLPDKTKPLYSHSLPCIEAWLRSLGFYQSRDDRALWFVENPDWQARLSLDITELHIRLVFNLLLVPFTWTFMIKIIFLVCVFG